MEEVLARTGHDRSHCPRLPGWFMVWFVIALGLFCRDCYRQVFRWLQPFRTRRERQRRIHLLRGPQTPGHRPLRLLAEQVIRLQGKPTTPGAFYRGMRTMALDGFVVDVPDTPANDAGLRPPRQQPRPGGLPPGPRPGPVRDRQPCPLAVPDQAQLRGEVTMAHYLLRFLQQDMLLLWDRNFLSYQTVAEVRQRGRICWPGSSRT